MSLVDVTSRVPSLLIHHAKDSAVILQSKKRAIERFYNNGYIGLYISKIKWNRGVIVIRKRN